MHRHVRMALLLATVAVWCPGCFVIDELDSGLEEMKSHSPKSKRAPAAEVAPEESSASQASERARALRADVKKWWKNARTPASKEASGDPEAQIIRCRMGSAVRFMTQSDCLSQGGTY